MLSHWAQVQDVSSGPHSQSLENGKGRVHTASLAWTFLLLQAYLSDRFLG